MKKSAVGILLLGTVAVASLLYYFSYARGARFLTAEVIAGHTLDNMMDRLSTEGDFPVLPFCGNGRDVQLRLDAGFLKWNSVDREAKVAFVPKNHKNLLHFISNNQWEVWLFLDGDNDGKIEIEGHVKEARVGYTIREDGQPSRIKWAGRK